MQVFKYFLFFLCFFSSCAYAQIEATDDLGHHIQLSQPAQRIISLSPDLTEILFAIRADSHVVGVIHGSDFPAEAKTLTQVGNYAGLDLERIIALHPDLIVSWGSNFAKQLEVLRNLNIPIYIVVPHHLEDVARTMQHLGELSGTQPTANPIAQQFLAEIKKLRETYSKQKHLKVFYQIGAYSLLSINHDSWINEAIRVCGGENVFAKAQILVPEVSWEAVVAANPEVVLNAEQNNTWQEAWQKWPMVRAVQAHALITLQPDWIERAGPRLALGVRQICQALNELRSKSL